MSLPRPQPIPVISRGLRCPACASLSTRPAATYGAFLVWTVTVGWVVAVAGALALFAGWVVGHVGVLVLGALGILIGAGPALALCTGEIKPTRTCMRCGARWRSR